MQYENTNNTFISIFLITVKAVVVSMILTAAALLLLALLVTYGPVDESVTGICVKAETYISVFFAAMTGAGKIRSKGWLLGLLTAITYIFLMFCIAELAFENTFFGGANFKNMFACILSGMFGGILGVNLKRKNKK